MVHPFVAILGAAYLIWAAISILSASEGQPRSRSAAIRVITLTLFQVIAGAVNLSLLAPLWMQLFHLLLADIVWIAVVVMVLEAATVRRPAPMVAYA
jgi:heme A synthase